MADDQDKMIAVKEAPNLDPSKIPQGLAGAQWIRNWSATFRNEFFRKYGRNCKPYRFEEVRWLWEGSIAAIYGDVDIKYTHFQNEREFNAAAKK